VDYTETTKHVSIIKDQLFEPKTFNKTFIVKYFGEWDRPSAYRE
jgi:hypothetical protein